MKVLTWFGLLLAAMTVSVANAYPVAGPGLHTTDLIYTAGSAGQVSIYNSNAEVTVNVNTVDGWLISSMQIYVGAEPPGSTLIKGITLPSRFPFAKSYRVPVEQDSFVLNLSNDLDFSWGRPWESERVRYVALNAILVQLSRGRIVNAVRAWAAGEPGDEVRIWNFQYELAHPETGHFRDSPVVGLTMNSPTFKARTGDSGEFSYFPGESAEFSIGGAKIGEAVLGQRVTPLDLFGGADINDPRVINVARLLQSLDADGEPDPFITITPAAEVCLASAMEINGVTALDFTSDALIEELIIDTIMACSGVNGLSLIAVSADQALANLEAGLKSNMFRRNVSKSPNFISAKAKMNVMPVWFSAKRADESTPTFFDQGTIQAGIPYYDENSDLIRAEANAKPLVVTYVDNDDVHAAISRDDGQTFKRMNISRSADISSFTLENGRPYLGLTKKPVFNVKGNKIFVAWSSKFCHGGKPAYAIDTEDDYTYDDPYYQDDIFGVGGPQLSYDYTEDGYPEVGEIPFSCVWSARGVVASASDVSKGVGEYVGDIVWFKPERMTSARRDAIQLFTAGASNAGFAVAWQEDPEGLSPGEQDGPGHGWSGATVSNKTDIWYSHISWSDFAKVDKNFVAGGDPEHDLDVVGRPKALVPMSLPMRISDNETVNTDNLLVELDENGYPVEDANGNWIPIINPDTDGDGSGTHAYGYRIAGLCEGFYEFINNDGAEKKVCITADGRLLDGNTGSSRANLMMQPYTKSDGTTGAWAIMNYEETKGAGSGSPDHEEENPYGDDYVIEEGKNVIYHSFDFMNPQPVGAGHIVNLPERDANGNLVYLRDEEGSLVLDYLGQPQLAYENARRARFILQGKGAMGATKTPMLIVYKEGPEGKGRPSDIMLRRFSASGGGNPYDVKYLVDGVQNLSSVTPLELVDIQGDPETDDPYVTEAVVKFEQTRDNLHDRSLTNPYEDARAHRGQIRGDFVVMGYTYTPNWAASRNGNDKYDFYVRRSFDGGQTWTTDPAGNGVERCNTFTYPSGTEGPGEKVEECTTYAAGVFEQAHNVSRLANNKSTVSEPRIVATPGTIKKNGVWTGIAEDKQNKAVYYVSYGTATNPKKDPVSGLQEDSVPEDLLYSFTRDKGENYVLDEWVVNPDSDGNYAGETVQRMGYLARGVSEQGEAQLRMTPDGSRFYSSWLEEDANGSGIMFRRIMPSEFPGNHAP